MRRFLHKKCNKIPVLMADHVSTFHLGLHGAHG
jgi:hypothetical protein